MEEGGVTLSGLTIKLFWLINFSLIWLFLAKFGENFLNMIKNSILLLPKFYRSWLISDYDEILLLINEISKAFGLFI